MKGVIFPRISLACFIIYQTNNGIPFVNLVFLVISLVITVRMKWKPKVSDQKFKLLLRV